MQWMIMPFRRYADFQGRSRRMEFWMFQLLNLIVGLVLAGPVMFSVVSAGLADPAAIDVDPFAAIGALGWMGIGLYALYALAAFIPSIAVTVRRLHDRDLSGWWYLGAIVAGLIPIVGLLASVALFVVLLLPGTKGPNRFGPDPKDPFESEVFA